MPLDLKFHYNACCYFLTVAIEAILCYSESVVELLKRKKLRRDDLFQYLAAQNVAISPKADKHDLIQKVLEHWGSSKPVPEKLSRVRVY